MIPELIDSNQVYFTILDSADTSLGIQIDLDWSWKASQFVTTKYVCDKIVFVMNVLLSG